MIQQSEYGIKVQKLLFVDAGVLDAADLLADHQPSFKVIALSSESDPIQQISQALCSNSPVSEITILAHAQPGKIEFSNNPLNLASLNTREGEFINWSNWLTTDAKICIYACRLASGEVGNAFIQTLGRLTKTEVASSSSPIGKVGAGQNWSLDRFTESFEVLIPFHANSMNSYRYTLAPTITISDASVSETNSPSSTLNFAVTLSEVAATDVFIDYQTINGTAREQVDFAQTSGTLTIAAGTDSGIIPVSAFGDSQIESDEALILELTNPHGAEFLDAAVSLRAAGTILDNDGTGSKLALLVDDVRVIEGDSGVREAVFLVRLSRDPTVAVTLDYTTTDGSASAGQDYVSASGSLTFSPGDDLVQEVSISLIGDTAIELSETFSLTFTPTAAIINDALGASGIATILDDDASNGLLPVLSLSAGEMTESNSPSRSMDFIVTLSEPASTDIRVDYQTISGTSKEQLDFTQTIKSSQLIIAAGETSGIISIPVTGDQGIETDEGFALELTDIQGAVFAGDATRLQAQGVILDNDGGGNKLALLVGDAQVVEGDSGTREAVFEVRLSQPPSEAISLSYVTRDGSAISGTDYVEIVGALTFLPGETLKSVSVPLFGDTVVEGTESFSLVFTPTTAIANGAFGAAGIATILDDDAGNGTLPILSLSAGEITESNSPSRSMEFVVTLSEPSNNDVIVDYQTINGMAREAVDITQTRELSKLIITAGETSGTITISVTGDSADEADEDFVLELTNVQGAVFAGDAAQLRTQGVILDNDGGGNKLTLMVSDVQVVEGDSGAHEAVFEVRLSKPVDDAVTVAYSTASGTASAGSDFTPLAGTITFLAGQTLAAVHVPVSGDTVVEASETFSLVLSAPQGTTFAAGGSGIEGIAKILDDDAGGSAEPVISIERTEMAESNSPSRSMEFVVSLSAPSNTPVRVDYATLDGTALDSSDYTATSGIVEFAPGQTSAIILVAIRGDGVEEPDEMLTLRLSSPQNAVLAGGVDTLDATGTILDNDGPLPVDGLPILSVADIQVQEVAGGTTATFTLNLSGPSATAVSGGFAIQEGTATAGVDFTAAPGNFTINANELSTTVTVNILDDALVEGTETFVLRLSEIDNARLSGSADTLFAIGEITDNETSNTAPVANDDLFSTDEDTPINGSVLDDNGNGADSDVEGDALSVTPENITTAAGALVVLNADGTFSYDPNGQFESLDDTELTTDSFEYTLSDGDLTDTATVNVEIKGVSDSEAVIVTIGDAPLRVSRTDPNAWENAWTNNVVDINHKANYTDAAEAWSSATLNGRSATVLGGGDIFGGDLGVSGQSLVSSNIRQEIDGTEALRFDLAQTATSVTVDLSRLEGGATAGSYDAGRLQLLDTSGSVVDELVFSADATGHEKQITLDHGTGFSSVVLTAGSYNAADFVFGGLVDAAGLYQSDPVDLGDGTWDGSDYLLNAIEFEIQVVGAPL